LRATAVEGQRSAHVTPVARKVAQENGLDPSQLTGSGTGGRIVKGDVLGALQNGNNAAAPTPCARSNSAREERV
jgi:2-oxoglutarate dehydrogenase E2 component (dihydrolipoamide succinyltransferase)